VLRRRDNYRDDRHHQHNTRNRTAPACNTTSAPASRFRGAERGRFAARRRAATLGLHAGFPLSWDSRMSVTSRLRLLRIARTT
jgi:hypothetical protein